MNFFITASKHKPNCLKLENVASYCIQIHVRIYIHIATLSNMDNRIFSMYVAIVCMLEYLRL